MTSLNKMYCRPGVSRNNRVGMFAVRRIPKGTAIMPVVNLNGTWKTVEWAKENGVSSGVIAMMQDYVRTKDSDHLFVPHTPLVAYDGQMLINQSSRPNVHVSPNWHIVASRDIENGEELFENYLSLK